MAKLHLMLKRRDKLSGCSVLCFKWVTKGRSTGYNCGTEIFLHTMRIKLKGLLNMFILSLVLRS